MKQIVSFFLSLAFFSCLGCLTLQVKRAPAPPTPALENRQGRAEDVPGLPFYVKKAACLHTAVWFEPVYTLSLDLVTASANGAPKSTTAELGTAVLSLEQLQASPAQNLFHALNGDSPTIQSVMKAWLPVATQLGTPYTPTAFPSSSNRILISNISAPQTYVDYSQPYYINAKRPIAGSVKLDNKLASDGTLTEVSAEVEEKAIEATTAGFKDVVSAVGTAAKAELVPNTVQRLKLSVVTTGFKHTLSTFERSTTLPCSAGSPEITPPYEYSRIEVSTASNPKKPDTKGSKITVSGEILLPEPKASTDNPETPAPMPAPTETKKTPK